MEKEISVRVNPYLQRTMNDMIILDLVLKGKWYDMIERGEKLEEYREIKPYWDKRLFSRPYTHVRFRRGYTSKSMTYTIPGEIRKGFGFSACWGAPPNKQVYIIPIGTRVE